MIIYLDGITGSGKSFQCNKLCHWLNKNDKPTEVVRAPGGTYLGEQLRNVLLAKNSQLTPMTEALLFSAGFVESLDKVIYPLSETKNIILDRFCLSTLAYQFHDVYEEFWNTMKYITDSFEPDLTFILDVPAQLAMRRHPEDERDRFDLQGVDYMERVRQAYIGLHYSSFYEKMYLIDASQYQEQVHEQIVEIVKQYL